MKFGLLFARSIFVFKFVSNILLNKNSRTNTRWRRRTSVRLAFACPKTNVSQEEHAKSFYIIIYTKLFYNETPPKELHCYTELSGNQTVSQPVSKRSASLKTVTGTHIFIFLLRYTWTNSAHSSKRWKKWWALNIPGCLTGRPDWIAPTRALLNTLTQHLQCDEASDS